jgi:hypothetical protein
MITYLTVVLKFSLGEASLGWGLITLLAGAFGSGAGGIIMDEIRKKYDYVADPKNSILVALKISYVFAFLVSVICRGFI